MRCSDGPDTRTDQQERRPALVGMAEDVAVTRIYIAGPMTGIEKYNYPAFNAKAAELRALGHHVENPAENPVPDCGSWEAYMRMAITQLMTCDEIHLLPGWTGSVGFRRTS